MNDKKRWASKEEAKTYIANAIRNNNLGLSFCSACDYVGVNPVEYVNRINDFCLGIYDECVSSWRPSDIKNTINLITYDLLCKEYLEGRNRVPNNDPITEEEYLNVYKDVLERRRLYIEMERNNSTIPIKNSNGEYIRNKRCYIG